MDRRELEIMLNEAFDRGIVSVGHLVHETVEVGFLNELGRTVGFTLNGWKEAIETIPVDLFDSFDDGRGRERFLSDCKALGGKVPQNTYRGELVSALADVLMVEEAAPALGALESALDSARRKGYCVFDRGVHGDVPAGIKAQAEAYNGMDNPYLLANRYIDIMPKVAEQVAKPLTAVDSIKMYGSGNAQKLVKETTSIVDQVASGLKDSTGIDLPSLLNGLISNPDIDADSAENSVE